MGATASQRSPAKVSIGMVAIAGLGGVFWCIRCICLVSMVGKSQKYAGLTEIAVKSAIPLRSKGFVMACSLEHLPTKKNSTSEWQEAVTSLPLGKMI